MWLRESFAVMRWMCRACACSTANAEAPEAGRMHTKAAIGEHGPEAETDLNACKICHSPDLNGSDAVIGCVDCHGSPQPFHLRHRRLPPLRRGPPHQLAGEQCPHPRISVQPPERKQPKHHMPHRPRRHPGTDPPQPRCTKLLFIGIYQCRRIIHPMPR